MAQEYKAFIVEAPKGVPLASFDTEAEACAYVETHNIRNAEIYDLQGDLVCFYISKS